MKYKEFKNEIINKYQKSPGIKKGDIVYLSYLKRRDVWDKLSDLKDIDIIDVILGFLNKWKCRIHVTPGLIKKLQKIFKELDKYFISIEGEELESFDFAKDVIIDGNKFKIESIIIRIFERLCYIKAGRRNFGATATSKVMHMINPDFFMMYDDGIRKEHGCYDNANGYVNFMWRMQNFCKDIIRNYQDEFGVNKGKIKEKIFEEICHDNWVIPKEYITLPKLIDEFNYSRRP